MPLVTVTLRPGRGPEFKTSLLNAVHRALVASGVPAADLFQRVLDLSEENFRFDARYPDLTEPRTGDFVLLEILWSTGRSGKVKRQVGADIVAGLQRDLGLNPQHVMLCFKETLWENWSFSGGTFLHV